MSNLYEAHRQWASRPDDERFGSIEEMRAACHSYFQSAKEASGVKLNTLRVIPKVDEQDLALVGSAGTPAKFTNYSFGQLCRYVGAPARYMAALPAALVSENLNHGLQKHGGESNLLLHANGELVLRCMTSDQYSRYWNWEVCDQLIVLGEHGWRVPPARPARANQAGTRAAVEADILKMESFWGSVKVGDPIAPAGLYASDHDMFAFMIHESKQISSPGKTPLYRGFFVSGSEVGSMSHRLTMFYFDKVCGNHIIWDVGEVKEVRLRHVGSIRERVLELEGHIKAFGDSSAEHDEKLLLGASQYELGADKDEVIDFVSLRLGLIGKKKAEDAYLLAVAHEQDHGNPRSAWGFTSGLTRLSQLSSHQDERDDLDRAAAKILDVVFETIK